MLSGKMVLTCNLFEETYFCHLHAYLLACFYEIHLKFLLSHIYFYVDNFELWKRYQSVNQEMMGQICDLETVEPHEIPIKVCIMFCNIQKFVIEVVEKKKQVFLQLLNIPKCIGVDLSMVEGLFSLLF